MKKYSEDLLQKLKERQSTQDYYGMEIVVKNLPDCYERRTAYDVADAKAVYENGYQ